MRQAVLVAWMALTVAACDQGRPVEPDFVARVRLDAARTVFLNQAISIVFSEPVDPLTLASETLRVVDVAGHVVPGQQVDVVGTVVTLRFRPPLTSSLTDGSLAPDQDYRLEVIGYPELHSVRARTGRVLARSVFTSFRTVGRQGRSDYPRALLPEEVGGPFALTRRPELIGSTGVLRLTFSRPPDPVSVHPAAFRVHRWHEGAVGAVEIASASATSGYDGVFGATVELRLRAAPPVDARDRDRLWVTLVDGDPGLVDYGGKPLVGERLLDVALQAESSRVVAKIVASEMPALHQPRLDQLGFEVRDGARITPSARLAGGTGHMGFVRLDGTVPLTPGVEVLELAGLEIPAGTRLTLGGQDTPVLVRVSGSVRVAGELVLATPRSAVVEPDNGAVVREDGLQGLAGCVIVAGGDIEISGRVMHVHERQPMGPSLALIAGRRLVLTGRTPPGMVYACDGQVVGHAQGASPRGVFLPRGWPGATATEAAGFTDWIPVPTWATGELFTQLVDVDGAIEVFVQSAPAHPLDTGKPDPQAESWSQLRPAGEPLTGLAGRFVRFALRGQVLPAPAPLPSVGAILLLAR